MKIVKLSFLVAAIATLTGSCHPSGTAEQNLNDANGKLEALQKRLKQGWNTWDVHDVLSQVLLPECLALTVEIAGIKDTVRKPYLGQNWNKEYALTPNWHEFDGSFTDLTIHWRESRIRVQSAAEGDRLVMLFTAENLEAPVKLTIKPELKWGRSGMIKRNESGIEAILAKRVISVHSPEGVGHGISAGIEPALVLDLEGKTGISTGRAMSISEIERCIKRASLKYDKFLKVHEENREIWDAMHSVFAWNTIYDPVNDRIFSPVSRSWCEGHDFVLFEWDTYLGAFQLSRMDEDLSYANIWAITSEITDGGFVPNFTTGIYKSTDRSQPPVGSVVALEIYKRTGDRWILDLLFDRLLTWNRWWPEHRDTEGYLCWGSDPVPLVPEAGELDRRAINKLKGAKYESGLDDSPMYDDVPYDTTRHMMELADVGLMSLYIADCKALFEIAGITGRNEFADELKDRAGKYSASLETLWDEESGIFLNRNLETGEFSHRLSPTNFYPLIAGVPTQEQAIRMVREHFYNPEEFWGDWIMPSISRNDPAFSNQYWRGRIWGPMNCLVYLGMRNYDLTQARSDLARKSAELMLKTFRENRMVHENYNPYTGEGTSDDYYHWGGLLGFLTILEIEGRK